MVAKEIRVSPIQTKVDARYMKYILRSGFQVSYQRIILSAGTATSPSIGHNLRGELLTYICRVRLHFYLLGPIRKAA